ncbi:uncharacterized protein C9orf131 homolog [Sorex fumeus]|uniref:uncharacterized protein C9orf131 homolog n=1 Tax=Sorex fumeus TaxID=62283 RepID=UPI0024AD75E0|nr:uncharacterized protein C9orf131 homolog [Sorex fumeus]
MDRLFESLLEVEDTKLLWEQLTHALVCRHCGSNCLQSPGNLGLSFLYQMAFLDHLWKQKSEEEDEEEEEEEKEESVYLLKPGCLPKENPVGQQATIVPSQSFCGSEGLHKGTRTPKQVLMQTPSRSFPTFQTLINLPVRYKTTPGSHLLQRKSQLYWGLPSLHSESLEAIFLSSEGSSPRKLSVSPSVLFNKLITMSSSNLLSQYCSLTQLPNLKDVEGTAPDPQQLSSPSFPPVPLLPLHLKLYPTDHKEVLCVTEQRRVPRVSEDQVLHSQLNLQTTTPSKLPYSSEVSWEVTRDPSLQHIPDLLSASLFYPSSHLETLTRLQSPRKTKEQSENPKVSNPPRLAPSSFTNSWPEFQGTTSIKGLFGSHVLWETKRQNDNHQMVGPPILASCQPIAPILEPQETSHLGIPPPTDETRWTSIGHTENPQTPESPLLAQCYHLDFLSELNNISPEGRLFAPIESWGHRENPQSSESPLPAPAPPNLQSGVQEDSPLGDSTGCKSQEACRENSAIPWDFEPPPLDLNLRFSTNRPVCSPLGTETLLKGMQSQKNVWISANSVSPPSLLSVPTLDSLEKIPKNLFESKALQKTEGQRENLWTLESSAPSHNLPLAPVLEPPRINPMGGLPKSDTAWKGYEHFRNSWACQLPTLAFSSPPVLVLESPSIRPMGIQFDSDRCGVTHRKNSCASEPLASNLPQHPYATPLGLSDFEPVSGDTEQKEICYVRMSQLCGLSPTYNTMSKFHRSESTGDKPNHKLEGPAVEQENWVPVPNSFSATSSNAGDNDLGFMGKNARFKEFPLSPSPPTVNSLQSPWSPIPEVLRIEPDQSDPPKRGLPPGAKMEALPSQGDGPQVPKLLRIQAWHWSRQMELRLQKLHQRPMSRFPDSSRLVSPPALGSTLGTCGLPSWSPQQTHPLILHPHSPSYQSLQSQSTGTQPVQVSPCLHSLISPQAHVEGHGRAEKELQTGEKTRGKATAEVSPQGPVHKKAGKNCQGLGKLSNLEVPTSSKRKDKASVQSLAQERENPKKTIARDHRGGDAGLGSPRITGKRHTTQTSVCRPSPRYSHRHQCCQYTAFLQQLHSKATGPQDQRGAKTEAGDILTPWHCKFCPQAHMEKQVVSTHQTAFSRGLQRVLAKFVVLQIVKSTTLIQHKTKTAQYFQGSFLQFITRSFSNLVAHPKPQGGARASSPEDEDCSRSVAAAFYH